MMLIVHRECVRYEFAFDPAMGSVPRRDYHRLCLGQEAVALA